ncbi:Membrane-bound alkaline phosphatase [Eumeta japonica]|uniref:Alkaline phosphatase n=1 Tax=Eumeta variegata TaxID=151549 RepID=A0A4C1ST71_EUMVA|nr:Membrane-bound alkaline phosphatase [Eumeta japonica]
MKPYCSQLACSTCLNGNISHYHKIQPELAHALASRHVTFTLNSAVALNDLHALALYVIIRGAAPFHYNWVNPQHPYEEFFNEKNPEHWRMQAQWLLYKKLMRPLNTGIAKNVIMFLGDGMSISTLAATRVYMAKGQGYFGEELKLSFEDFPYTGLSKTYCVDSNVADSACSGTAYLTGVKANYGTIGVSGGAERGRCGVSAGGDAVPGLTAWAQRAGKKTGVVTTTRITHATPASAYAHSAERRWEADADIPAEERFCQDIASQLVRGEVGSKIDVILGGGRSNFYSTSQLDNDKKPGRREDGANLIEEWLVKKNIFGSTAKYVENRSEFLDLDVEKYNSILGLFSEDHLPYHLEANSAKDPTLSEMTQKAIEILGHRNENGFFLFVEGKKMFSLSLNKYK